MLIYTLKPSDIVTVTKLGKEHGIFLKSGYK